MDGYRWSCWTLILANDIWWRAPIFSDNWFSIAGNHHSQGGTGLGPNLGRLVHAQVLRSWRSWPSAPTSIWWLAHDVSLEIQHIGAQHSDLEGQEKTRRCFSKWKVPTPCWWSCVITRGEPAYFDAAARPPVQIPDVEQLSNLDLPSLMMKLPADASPYRATMQASKSDLITQRAISSCGPIWLSVLRSLLSSFFSFSARVPQKNGTRPATSARILGKTKPRELVVARSFHEITESLPHAVL